MSYSIVRRRRRPNASLLAEAVRTIGKRRFEIRQQVSCPLEDRKLHYLVETWFFFPQSLQINRWSYTATDYQQSLKNYIRLGGRWSRCLAANCLRLCGNWRPRRAAVRRSSS